MSSESTRRSQNRDIYRQSRERVDNALEIFGMAKPDKSYTPPPDDELSIILDLIHTVLQDHETEEATEYKETILGVSRWLVAALSPQYLKMRPHQGMPETAYVVRKGLELLHLLLHRDLRRRQFSPTEASLVQEFVALATQYPDPEAEGEMTRTGS